MTKEELKARVNYKPIQLTDLGLGDLKRDTKLTPFQDIERSFTTHYVNGRPVGHKNVLAKTNDAAAMAMCKDSK